VIDEAGAARMLLPESKRRKTVTLKDVDDRALWSTRIEPKLG